uniref:CD40 ligand n=1 Tax=Leptobrachium leishanense TaxID=445787 RepID=A0A8C5PFV7_9ANUR
MLTDSTQLEESDNLFDHTSVLAMSLNSWAYSVFMVQSRKCNIYIVYLYHIPTDLLLILFLDKIEKEISFHDDYTFLRRIQKCKKGENPDTTLLNCTKVVYAFRSMISEVGLKLYSQVSIQEHPIVIHLVGEQSNRREVLQWMLKGYAQTRNQITYTNGYLQVEVPGVYYVYSQVTFCQHKIHSSRAPFVQYIFLRRQHETDTLLLRGANAQFFQTADCALQSIQQGAVFTFQQNDLIFVNVTDSSLINYNPGLTYFGMFKL